MTFFNKRGAVVAALMAASTVAILSNPPRNNQLDSIVISAALQDDQWGDIASSVLPAVESIASSLIASIGIGTATTGIGTATIGISTASTGIGTASTATSTASASRSSPNGPLSSARGSSQYKQFSSSGSTQDGWPAASQWTSFDVMWNNALNIMTRSCSNLDKSIPNNSQQEINSIRDAINSQASATKVDPRFILAVVLQESGGCVRVKTTGLVPGGVPNPGLMQDHNGTHTCNDGQTIQNPCPQAEIQGMITDGVSGTSSGDGLSQCLSRAPNRNDQGQQTYEAARLYNSGSIDASGKLEEGIATHCYSSDIANRLVGWDGQNTTCRFDGKPSQKLKYRKVARTIALNSYAAPGWPPAVLHTPVAPETHPRKHSHRYRRANGVYDVGR